MRVLATLAAAVVLTACGAEVALVGTPGTTLVTGVEGWVALPSPPRASPVVVGDRLVVSEGGRFHVLQPGSDRWRRMDDLPFDGDGTAGLSWRPLPDGRVVAGASTCDRGFEVEGASQTCEGSWRFQVVASDPDHPRRWGEPVDVETAHDADPGSDLVHVSVAPDLGEDLVLRQTDDVRIDALAAGGPIEWLVVDLDDGRVLDRSEAPPRDACGVEGGRIEHRYGLPELGEASPNRGDLLVGDVDFTAYAGTTELGRVTVSSTEDAGLVDVACTPQGLVLYLAEGDDVRVGVLDLADVAAGGEVAFGERFGNRPWPSGVLLSDREAETTLLVGADGSFESLPYVAWASSSVRYRDGVVACWSVGDVGGREVTCFLGTPSPTGRGRPVPDLDAPVEWLVPG